MRIDGWEARLAEYIESKRHVPFSWGDNDCVSFANGAFKAQTGSGFCDDCCGQADTALTAARFFRAVLQDTGFKTALDMIDARLLRGHGFPPRGSIMALPVYGHVTGFAFGVVVSHKAAFVGVTGLEFNIVTNSDKWWVIK